jgi:hypothetical protein
MSNRAQTRHELDSGHSCLVEEWRGGVYRFHAYIKAPDGSHLRTTNGCSTEVNAVKAAERFVKSRLHALKRAAARTGSAR